MDLIVQYVISEISKPGLASPRTLLCSPQLPATKENILTSFWGSGFNFFRHTCHNSEN